MGKIKLAVAGETLFAERLAECMQKNAPEYLEVLSCRTFRELPEFLTQMQPDILLSEQAADIEKTLAKQILQIQLAAHTDFSNENPGQTKKQIQIFRYQRGSEILRQIFEIYAHHAKKNLVYRCKTADIEMTALYAPGGHELLLAFSISYAALCGKNEKVLYLNLSEFSGMRTLLGDKDGTNLSDLIFGIRRKKERFLLCLQSVLHHAEQFDYVLPPENPEDLHDIQADDLICLLELLQEQTEYKKIIWNCGTLNQAAGQVMEYCSKVFCVVKENAFGKYRNSEFEQYLQKELRQRLKDKVTYVNPQTGNTAFVQGVDLLTQLQSKEFLKQVQTLTEAQTNGDADKEQKGSL